MYEQVVVESFFSHTYSQLEMLRLKFSDSVFLFCLFLVMTFLSVIFWAFEKQEEMRRLHKYELKLRSLTMNYSVSVHNTSFPLTENGENDDSAEIESDSDIEAKSYPPCHSFGGMLWLHDISSGECYEVGTQGPCGLSMTFYANPDKDFKIFGFCDCDDIVEVKSSKAECEGVERPLIYYPPLDRCFTVFNKGPCDSDEWLELSDSLKPICTRNICPYGEDDDEFSLDFWFSQDGQCYENHSRGYCDKGYKLRISKHNWKPQCKRDNYDSCPLSNSVNIPTLKCRPGNRLNQLGKCNWPSKYRKI